MLNLPYNEILPHFGSIVDCDVNTISITERNQLINLLATRKVLIFPRQTITAQQLVRFSELMGRCWSNETPLELAGNGEERCSHPDTRQVTLVSNDGTGVLGDMEIPWHNDIAHRPHSLAGNTLPFRILYGEHITPLSAPTMWFDQEWAYDNLRLDLKIFFEHRKGFFKAPYRTSWDGCRRPLVLTNPITGRKSITADMLFLNQIDGLSVEDTAKIKQQIIDAGATEQNIIKHVWSSGDLVINNNFCTAHYRPRVANKERRVLWRTTFQIADLIPPELI